VIAVYSWPCFFSHDYCSLPALTTWHIIKFSLCCLNVQCKAVNAVDVYILVRTVCVYVGWVVMGGEMYGSLHVVPADRCRFAKCLCSAIDSE